jgi:hypothetical protein
LQGETWADGDVLYLSPTTAGRLTNIKPTGATGHIVVIGYVEYSHASQGAIYVKIMNGWELDELHNVYISSPANNDALIYESSTQLWKNKSLATALGYTPVTDARTISTTAPLTGGGDLTANRTFGITKATASVDGYLASTDFTTFNGKQDAITLTTTGTSGAATLVGATLNIPQYSGGGGVIYKNAIDSASFLGTSNTAVYTQLIDANTFTAGDIIRVTYRTKKLLTNGAQTLRIYVNSTANLSGTPLLLGAFTSVTTSRFNQMLRHLVIKTSTNNTEVCLTTFSVLTDIVNTGDFATISVNWTNDLYFVFAVQNNSALDTNYGSMYLIEKL